MKKYFIYLAILFPIFAQATTPDHLLFLVFDQMRPDYVDRYDLKNFKRIRALGTNYKNAYVGQMSALTVVSHVTMTTGLLAKDLPWADAVTWDKDGTLFGIKDQFENPMSFGADLMLKTLKQNISEKKFLIKRLKDVKKGKVFSVGQKNYSSLAMGGPYADSIIYMQKNSEKTRWVPAGIQLPPYIAKNERYEVDAKETYNTGNSFYGLSGNQFFPGKDAKHLGGDVWVADLALDIMQNEKDWAGIFLTFGSIDKFGHMLGETDGLVPLSFETPAHLKDILKIADTQLGKILDYLEKHKLIDSTLIVLTADHGAQTDQIYLGNGGDKSTMPFWIDRVASMGKIRANVLDTSIRLWMADTKDAALKKAVSSLREISKVTKIFQLDDKTLKYKEVFSNTINEPKGFQDWAKKHDEELVNTMANDRAPQLVALFADGVGFGKLGDHGGAQEKVQRIPLYIAGPGIVKRTSTESKRLVDIAALIDQAMKLK